MPATPADLALFCLAIALVGGWVVWVAIPTVADLVRLNPFAGLIVWPCMLSLCWPAIRPLIHALTG